MESVLGNILNPGEVPGPGGSPVWSHETPGCGGQAVEDRLWRPGCGGQAVKAVEASSELSLRSSLVESDPCREQSL